jgi:hypothetical protein
MRPRRLGRPSPAVARDRTDVLPPALQPRRGPVTTQPPDEEHSNVADKSPRQHQSTNSGTSLTEKRTEKNGTQAAKRLGS